MIKICERGRQEQPVCGDRGSFYDRNHVFQHAFKYRTAGASGNAAHQYGIGAEAVPGESSTIIQKMALAVIFGAISIVSTYTGTKTGGAIVNTRVIGVLTAGIMGGPLVGMMTALIAGAHRFLFDIGGFYSSLLRGLDAGGRRAGKSGL